jgi:hypothetical protein
MSKDDLRTADECDGVSGADYCPDCGCPKDICCKRVGAKEELKNLVRIYRSFAINEERDEYIINYLKKRLKSLEKEGD